MISSSDISSLSNASYGDDFEEPQNTSHNPSSISLNPPSHIHPKKIDGNPNPKQPPPQQPHIHIHVSPPKSTDKQQHHNHSPSNNTKHQAQVKDNNTSNMRHSEIQRRVSDIIRKNSLVNPSEMKELLQESDFEQY